jgi:hypothetical protein
MVGVTLATLADVTQLVGVQVAVTVCIPVSAVMEGSGTTYCARTGEPIKKKMKKLATAIQTKHFR